MTSVLCLVYFLCLYGSELPKCPVHSINLAAWIASSGVVTIAFRFRSYPGPPLRLLNISLLAGRNYDGVAEVFGGDIAA